jgi:protein-tyrosine-phosphatase/tRNA A37 threonylcarbamoyladenosine synthetase subunit TsaC/SUA5/YrdC
MTQVVAWQNGSAMDDVVRLTLQVLGDGGLVAFPTETSYVLAANGTSLSAVSNLQSCQGHNTVAVALKNSGSVNHWAPQLGMAGQRLAARLWPGPLTLVSSEGVRDSEAVAKLAEPLAYHIRLTNGVELLVPDHDVASEILRAAPWPVVVSLEADGLLKGMRSPEDVIRGLSREASLVVDDGLCFFDKPSTRVKVEGADWTILREGALPFSLIQEQAACRIVFVCTGNTCRSPLAEALLKKRLADRLGCADLELPKRGFVVLSAGLAAMIGEEAASEAVAVANRWGANLENHSSKQATVDLLLQADYVFAMTRSHLDLLAGMASLPGCRPRLLSPTDEDIADPIGGDKAVYEECARQIWLSLDSLLDELAPG